MLASIAALNLFSVFAFGLLVAIRLLAPERSYAEACIVTYVLVCLDVLLKLADASLPVALTVRCFPTSFAPPVNATLIAANCDVPCAIGDFYAMYGFYGVSKTLVGAVDVLIATPFLCRKPIDWYRWGSTRLK